ncbi:MAG: hypothetical protein ACR2N3_13965 [Pyrinomonadaceae bacterium]
MSPVLEEIIEKIHALPFVERRKLREILNNEDEEIEKERQRRIKLSKKIMGKYRDSLSSTDEFIAGKQEEIEMEDRGWQPKK